MNEIEKAIKAHKSIPENLKSSTEIVLAKPKYEIFYPRPQIPQCMKYLDIGGEYKRVAVISDEEAKHQHQQYITYSEEWRRARDHHLLMEMLENGFLPKGWEEQGGYAVPHTVSQALSVAKERGYNVPDKFLSQHESVSYSEAEALQAAHMMVYRNLPFLDGNRDMALRNTQKLVTQLSSQFIVPDPIYPDKTPYVIDQLWIVNYPNDKIRLIGLEIDGEIHLTQEAQERSRRRDAMLAAMGYEVYHVAGWWCRIDPYRVIFEFLVACGLEKRAGTKLVGSNFNTINEYRCQLCGEVMVRWDVNWIQKVHTERDALIAHCSCAEEFNEY